MKCPYCNLEMRSRVLGTGEDREGKTDILLEMVCLNSRCSGYGQRLTVARRVMNDTEAKERMGQ